MRLNAPKKITFWIAVVIAILGVIARFVPIDLVSSLAIWVVLVAFVLLALGNVLEGL